MRRLLHEVRLALVALQFLTRVPVPRWVGFDPAWLQACLRHFPLVGAGVGLFGAAVLWAASWLWPPAVAAVLSVAATVWLTGAFHEDGLADTCDGLGGAVSRERALAIMKDSRIGTYGAVALVLALGLKAATLAALVAGELQGAGGAAAAAADPAGCGPGEAASCSLTSGSLAAAAALVWGHAASRTGVLWLVWRLPYAGDAEHAKAKPLALQADGRSLAVAAVWLLLLAGGMVALFAVPSSSAWEVAAGGSGAARTVEVAEWFHSPVAGPLFAALGAGGLTTLLCARWLRRRLGGFTGDTLGATQQLVELAGLLAWAAWPAATQLVAGMGRAVGAPP